MGFEPTVGFPTLDFESSALNRTQPPFLGSKKKRPTFNAQRPTFNENLVLILSSLSGDLGILHWRLLRISIFGLGILLSHRNFGQGRPRMLPRGAFPSRWKRKKCYNFWLATANPGAAYCITAGELRYYLLSVTDWNSQVVGAAVRKY